MVTYWRYCPPNNLPASPRVAPDINAPKQELEVDPGTLLKVIRTHLGVDGLLYLQLADGGGWLFDRKPGLGTMCVHEGIRLHDLRGEWEAHAWLNGKLTPFMKWSLMDDGSAADQTGQMPPEVQLTEDLLPDGTARISRLDGWFINMEKSDPNHLVWESPDLPMQIEWLRLEEVAQFEAKREEKKVEGEPKMEIEPQMRLEPAMEMDFDLLEFEEKVKGKPGPKMKPWLPSSSAESTTEVDPDMETKYEEEPDAKPEYESLILEYSPCYCKIGYSEQHEPQIRIRNPGSLKDKEFWMAVLASINLKPGDPEPVVVGVPYTFSKSTVNEIYTLLFKELGMQHAYVATTAFFAAERLETCLLVDVDESGAYAVQKGPPHFVPQRFTLVCGGVGGGLLSEAMAIILRRAGVVFPEDVDCIQIGRAAKECFGYVAQSLDSEVESLNKCADLPNPHGLNWSREPTRKLPGGVRFRPERGEGCRCCELLFNPDSEGILAECRVKSSSCALTLNSISGTWLQPTTDDMLTWRIEKDGTAFCNGEPAHASASLRETVSGDGTHVISNGDGWSLNASSSSVDQILWTKAGVLDGDSYSWQRDPAERTEFLGLHELVLRSLALTAHMQTRAKLLSNILLVGNSSVFPGLAQRLEHEIRCRCHELVPDMDPGKVKVHTVLDPSRGKNVAWQGAALLADFKDFKKLFMTPDSFEATSQSGIVFV